MAMSHEKIPGRVSSRGVENPPGSYLALFDSPGSGCFDLVFEVKQNHQKIEIVH